MFRPPLLVYLVSGGSRMSSRGYRYGTATARPEQATRSSSLAGRPPRPAGLAVRGPAGPGRSRVAAPIFRAPVARNRRLALRGGSGRQPTRSVVVQLSSLGGLHRHARLPEQAP